jgi:hypothetical protein
MDLAKAGVVLALARIQSRHQGDLERMGLIDLIGSNRIFMSRQHCLEAYRAECLSEKESPECAR